MYSLLLNWRILKQNNNCLNFEFMIYTTEYTKNGVTFVHVGQNITNGRKRYCNVRAETLIALGYHQVVIIETEDSSLADGWQDIEGTAYWVKYQLIEPEVEEEIEEQP